ncbi:MAG: hypothetical protein QOK49_3815 [Baekduia sp.]|nr:hypothetical protein [Baekduia sp.]
MRVILYGEAEHRLKRRRARDRSARGAVCDAARDGVHDGVLDARPAGHRRPPCRRSAAFAVNTLVSGAAAASRVLSGASP